MKEASEELNIPFVTDKEWSLVFKPGDGAFDHRAVEVAAQSTLFYPKCALAVIKCNGSEFCLGTDKIGHFFQQGYMGFELGRAGFDDWVLAFFQMTEGLAVSPTPNGQKLIDGKYMHFSEWFNRTKFYFMGEGDVALQSYFRRWGGKLGGRTQSSTADVMANLAGKDFYDRLPDLCCCLKWYANNNTGPLPETQPCFDICGYVNALWEE